MRAIILSLVLAISVSTSANEIKRLVIIGDSITEGYGVAKEKSYPTLLQEKIDKAGKKWTVVNSGISGSTSASAAARVKWQLKNKPDLLLLALGANDGLRGLKVDEMEKNLEAAVVMAQEAAIPVVLAGMKMPPNLGQKYTTDFAKAFVHVAERRKIPIIPFLLEGVAGIPSLNQGDGIHPNEKGHEIVAQTVFAALVKFL